MGNAYLDIDLERLSASREKQKLTKLEAAKRIGVSQSTYVRYENGSRIPSIQVLTEIARVFNTSVEYLLGNTKTKKPTCYLIKMSEEPEIFKLIEITKKLDDKKIKRLLSYAKKL